MVCVDYDEDSKICLEKKVINYGGYVKGILTYTHDQQINKSNENVMNISLLKGFSKRTLMNEWRI